MAGKGLKGWLDAKAEAQKILGKEGKLPKPRVDFEAAINAANKVAVELAKLRDGMESKLVESQDAMAKVKNAANQYSDVVSGSDFELDAKDNDSKKKIKDVQKLLSDQLKELSDRSDAVTKIFSDVDKSLTGMSKQVSESV